MLRLGRIHRLAVVSRIVLWRENYHRAILDFCNNICHERTSEMVRPGSMNEFGTSSAEIIHRLHFVSTDLPMRPMPPVALDIGGYKALRLANAVRIGTLDANNRPTAKSYALHKPSLRIIIVHGIMLGRPVVPHGNGVRRPVKPELIFGNECLVK